MLFIKTKMIFAGLLLSSLLIGGCAEYNAKTIQEQDQSQDKRATLRGKITKEVNQERQRRLDATNRRLEQKQYANKLKLQTIVNDAYTEKDKILDELQVELAASIKDLDKETQVQLRIDENSFISVNKDKVQELKKVIRDKRSNVHRKIEEEISNTANTAEQKLQKKLERKISDYSKIEDDINNEYTKVVKITQNKHTAVREARYNILRENINAKNITNEEILSLKAEGLERERMLVADRVRKEAQRKNSIVINNNRSEHAAKMDLYKNAVNAELSKNEKAELNELKVKYDKTTLIRKSKKDKDIKDSLKYIKLSKIQAKKAKRKSLISGRNSMLTDLDKKFDSGVEQIKQDENKGLDNIKMHAKNKNLEERRLLENAISQKKDKVINATNIYVQNAKDNISAKNADIAVDSREEIDRINDEADALIENKLEQTLAKNKSSSN